MRIWTMAVQRGRVLNYQPHPCVLCWPHGGVLIWLLWTWR
ncbi:hypothetical protein APV28_3144 [Comamonas testosteroni]|nr:hypothetical protein APV28_3144 [Comamonas testosteroni]